MADSTTDIWTRPPVGTAVSAPETKSTRLWSRIVLGFIVLLSAFMNFYQLGQDGYGNLFYAAGVKSMGDSLYNFFFVSFDPGGFVTLDKPPLGFWLQVISTKVFGFTPFSVYLPQALSGVLGVLLLYALVRRHFGVIAGLAASVALAVSPISVVTNRNNTIDSTLALVLLLAAWAIIHAAESGKLRWLLLSGIFIGLGFNIKMAEAYLVLPAIALVYLFCAPRKLWTRIWHLLVFAVVMLALSLVWVITVDSIPASMRPYVDSTSDNSELTLATGYNGIERLLGQNLFGGGQRGSGTNTFKSDTTTSSSSTTKSSSTSSSTTKSSSSTTTNTGSTGNAATGETPPSGTGAPTTGEAPPNGFTGGGAPNGEMPVGYGGFGAGGPGGNGNFEGGAGGGTGTGQNGTQDGNTTATGAGGGAPGGDTGAAGGAGGGNGFVTGAAGPFRLFNSAYGGQISWLAVLALLGILAVAWQRRFSFRMLQEDHRYLGMIFWSIWFLTMGAFFSVASFFHPYYLTVMAPGVCAMFGIAIGVMWKDYRGMNWRGWLLPIALAANAVVEIYILSSYPTWSSWLSPLIGIVTGIVVLGLIIFRLGFRIETNRMARRYTSIALTLGTLVLLVAPTIWSGYSVMTNAESQIPSAGPTADSGGSFGGLANAGGNFTNLSSSELEAFLNSNFGEFAREGGRTGEGQNAAGGNFAGGTGGGTGNFGGGSGGSSGQADSKLVSFLESHQGSTKFLVATPSSQSADELILTTNKPVMSLGGFSGSDPILTVSELQTLIKNNTIRYFLLSGGGAGGFGGTTTTTNNTDTSTTKAANSEALNKLEEANTDQGATAGGGDQSSITSWVTSNCSTVSTSQWESTTGNQSSGGAGGGAGTLYDCSSPKS